MTGSNSVLQEYCACHFHMQWGGKLHVDRRVTWIDGDGKWHCFEQCVHIWPLHKSQHICGSGSAGTQAALALCLCVCKVLGFLQSLGVALTLGDFVETSLPH
jgi:hypothetical protein